MTVQYDRVKNDGVVEVLKRGDYKERSSSTDTKTSEPIVNRLSKLKTSPQPWYKTRKVTANLKATLPDISPREVRRFYMPYHKAILLELNEQDYQEAYRRMKEILELDIKIGEKSSSSLMWKKPYLKNRKDFIDRLKDGLMAFENGRREGNSIVEATSLLDIALFFQSKTWEWWWIVERLYQDALVIAEAIENDDRRTVTLIRYLYGRFLFNELQKPKEALNYLNEAREASKKKTWNASKILKEKQSSIFRECNILQYKALLILARKERPENPDYALKACTEALERATDADDTEYVNEALYELGKSYIARNDVKRALHSFSKLLALAKRIPDAAGVCNAHMELAFAYKQLNDNVHTEKHLRMFRENTKQFGLFEKLADAHYYTGEHYLTQGSLTISTSHLESALHIYNKLGLSREADRARSIAGISKGQERIEKFFELISRCGEHDKDAISKICLWKGRREPFWTDEIHGKQRNIVVHKYTVIYKIVSFFFFTRKLFHTLFLYKHREY
ncbi:uncharacterized protein LOC128884827 [Hylaeus volcanicus]|uniref:uncharacterized protein LOC128884827 n=1 Tax=Hylaeus volcanicus TaxID=313075 RepID=UPI0023B7AC50|nr:uncharacterized protein LOC128884827 [Hylaeus volcanicus]